MIVGQIQKPWCLRLILPVAVEVEGVVAVEAAGEEDLAVHPHKQALADQVKFLGPQLYPTSARILQLT